MNLKTYLMEEILKAQRDFYIPYEKGEVPPQHIAYRDKEARIKVKIYEDLLCKFLTEKIVLD